ncbi:hypothetical protein J4E93_005317 [Alternaria ventricosa]|uniref:uncharacterized protein n=1 Tax=Alternaria ventricosa TaxID=1187951 RepID=UPI0020C5262C|nr:uncharacterized protein J4E93_005317 [Alternaria ventricosa]KAI4645739.1 hypothetical protein J4E93_005317 [Alternaria ventricosa]
MRFRPEDLRQIHSIAAAQEIAIVTASDGGAALATLTYQPPATTTLTSFISIETLTTASGGHEAGDFVYHIPKTTAERIEDFLGMTGLQETQQICQGQSFKRADPTEECIERILHHAMSLVDTGPDDLMALAQANVPIEPAAGQAISFPIPNIYIGESVAFVRMYRQMNSATATTPQADQNWDPSLLARSALGLTIAAHAVMFTGQALMELFVGKDDVIKDFKEEDLACPKDLICTSVNCQGQKEVINPLTGETISKPPSTPTCLTVKNLGCRCGIVNYPYVWEVPQGYMDAQYEWLEELIKRADEPVLEAECKSDLQRSSFEGWIETACTEYDNQLDKEWHWTYSDITGFDFSFRWSQIPDGVTNCPFDCNAAFAPFLDSSDCKSAKPN